MPALSPVSVRGQMIQLSLTQIEAKTNDQNDPVSPCWAAGFKPQTDFNDIFSN